MEEKSKCYFEFGIINKITLSNNNVVYYHFLQALCNCFKFNVYIGNLATSKYCHDHYI